MLVEEWEEKRLCVRPPAELNVTPGCFDVDADESRRALAEACCFRCPVRSECEQKVGRDLLAGVEVSGFFAGRVWSSNTHGSRAIWVERRCANSECGKTFVAGKASAHKKYCSEACGERARRRPALTRAERRQRRIARGLSA